MIPCLGEWICYNRIIRYLNQIALIIQKNYKFIELDSYFLITGFSQDLFDGIYCQRDYYIK